VTGDPPTGRGQLAAPLQTEVTYPLKIQLRNRPPKRVIPKQSQQRPKNARPDVLETRGQT
jgi:hypothetical protein